MDWEKLNKKYDIKTDGKGNTVIGKITYPKAVIDVVEQATAHFFPRAAVDEVEAEMTICLQLSILSKWKE